METNVHAHDDLLLIRQMMERSSKFLSLSGLSGVFAGCTALVGAAYINWGILGANGMSYQVYLKNKALPAVEGVQWQLLIAIVAILVIALAGAVFFSVRKVRRAGSKPNGKSAKNMLVNLAIPLVSGGLFSLVLLWHNHAELLGACTLIFYGLALVNAGKFTFGEIHYLGLCQIVLGLIAAVFVNYSLLIWAFGFGVLHIGYGIILYRKYERQ